MKTIPKEKIQSWLVFENEVKQLVEAFGYQAVATQPSSGRGVDVIAVNHRRKAVIQCELYRKASVGTSVILRLEGTRQFYQATDALCITTSHFTNPALHMAGKLGIQLLDREQLLLLCRQRALTIPSLTFLKPRSLLSLRAFPLDKQILTVGREKGSSIRINSEAISRLHAKLERKGLTVTVYDYNSTNGTYLNDVLVVGCAPVNYGDILRFGPSEFVCELQIK